MRTAADVDADAAAAASGGGGLGAGAAGAAVAAACSSQVTVESARGQPDAAAAADALLADAAKPTPPKNRRGVPGELNSSSRRARGATRLAHGTSCGRKYVKVLIDRAGELCSNFVTVLSSVLACLG